MVLCQGDGRLWLGRRARTPGPYNWQFPQGGVDEAETLLDAALRELHEETGAKSVSLIGRTSQWLAYDFPEGYRRSGSRGRWLGQKQIWFAFRFDGEETEFDIRSHHPPEFDAWRWASPEEAMATIAPFKKATYDAMLGILIPMIDAAAQRKRHSGGIT